MRRNSQRPWPCSDTTVPKPGGSWPGARQRRIALQVVCRCPHRDSGQYPDKRKRGMAAPVDTRKPALLLIHRIVAAQSQDGVVVHAHVHVNPTVVRQGQRAAPMVRQLDRQLVAQEQLGGHGLRVLRIGQHDGIELAARPVHLLRRIRRPASPGQPQRQHRQRRRCARKGDTATGHGRGQAGEDQQPHHGNPDPDPGALALGDFCGRLIALVQDLHAQGVCKLALVFPAFRRHVHRHHVLQRPHLAARPLLALLLPAQIAVAAAGDVELAVQGHDNGEFFRHRHFGLIVLKQVVAGVIRQHHVDPAQGVMHGGPALAGLQPMAHERPG
ncbi:hypothetical protein G6F22_015114 [Rhizopus arrhizus]|nr:hypothetical protein G6F22_015114 [Rhizopus arrhizus]